MGPCDFCGTQCAAPTEYAIDPAHVPIRTTALGGQTVRAVIPVLGIWRACPGSRSPAACCLLPKPGAATTRRWRTGRRRRETTDPARGRHGDREQAPSAPSAFESSLAANLD